MRLGEPKMADWFDRYAKRSAQREPKMADWFDRYAKKSAQRGNSAQVGGTNSISRRRLIVGGSSAVATAWTAPMLMSSPAYAAVGQSACSTGQTFCGTTSTGIPVCCDAGNACDPTGGPGGGA